MFNLYTITLNFLCDERDERFSPPGGSKAHESQSSFTSSDPIGVVGLLQVKMNIIKIPHLQFLHQDAKVKTKPLLWIDNATFVQSEFRQKLCSGLGPMFRN